MADVYGTIQWLDAAVDKLVATLNSLKTAMASGYDPIFSYVYDSHGEIPVRLNAVSVELIGVEDNLEGTTANDAPFHILRYEITLTIRVHTNYIGRYNDIRKNQRLLNSIDNWLHTHRDLSGNYYITLTGDFNPREEFSETQTVGGSMTVIIYKTIDHQQV